jgi:hypothetical protein
MPIVSWMDGYEAANLSDPMPLTLVADQPRFARTFPSHASLGKTPAVGVRIDEG